MPAVVAASVPPPRLSRRGVACAGSPTDVATWWCRTPAHPRPGHGGCLVVRYASVPLLLLLTTTRTPPPTHPPQQSSSSAPATSSCGATAYCSIGPARRPACGSSRAPCRWWTLCPVSGVRGRGGGAEGAPRPHNLRVCTSDLGSPRAPLPPTPFSSPCLHVHARLQSPPASALFPPCPVL